jgi:ribosomal protein S18 acetylase RimI-like enzyme
MSPQLDIVLLSSQPQVIDDLSDLLIATVKNGDSVSFMYPLARLTAETFWKNSLAAADRNERVVLGAYMEGTLIGTVTLLLDFPPNQPHRGEIAKLMTKVSYRGQGVATSLLLKAEKIATERGKTLLTLDTAVEGGAASLYEKLGFQVTGIIPDFALKPYGGLTGTIIYWKHIGPTSQ